jgi:hypothetical protein
MYETNGHEEITVKYNLYCKKNGFIDGEVSKNNLQQDRWSFSFSLKGERWEISTFHMQNIKMKEKHHIQMDDWENNVAQAPTL